MQYLNNPGLIIGLNLFTIIGGIYVLFNSHKTGQVFLWLGLGLILFGCISGGINLKNIMKG